MVKRIDDETGAAALATLRRAAGDGGSQVERAPGGSPSERSESQGAGEREVLATAVRWTLQRLAERAPGHTVEVRVPPFGAVQAVEGPRHTRGTPPNVVETDARTWLALATGELAFSAALADGRVHASGTRTDLSDHLPLV
ncbi:MAG TPA: sterol carrier family protein [Microbacteriaceae bacterium]|nr:sterol carrier family protein [Microbacteriaceae bacterium]